MNEIKSGCCTAISSWELSPFLKTLNKLFLGELLTDFDQIRRNTCTNERNQKCCCTTLSRWPPPTSWLAWYTPFRKDVKNFANKLDKQEYLNANKCVGVPFQKQLVSTSLSTLPVINFFTQCYCLLTTYCRGAFNEMMCWWWKLVSYLYVWSISPKTANGKRRQSLSKRSWKHHRSKTANITKEGVGIASDSEWWVIWNRVS